jgi:drug/metabolite transporter, DME family
VPTFAITGSRRSAQAWRGLLLVSLAGVVWGTIGPGVDLAHDGSGLAPPTISAYRVIAAVAVLLGAVLLSGGLRACWSLAHRQWRRVAVVGVLSAAFQLLFFVSVVAIGVSVGTVVCLGFAPVLLLVVDSARRRSLPSGGRVVTVTIAVVGLLLVSLVGDAGDRGSSPALGVIAALGSGAAYALSTEAAAPLSRRLDTLTMTTATMSVAAIVLVPVGLGSARLRGDPLTTADVPSWLLITYLGVVTMAVAYALLFAGLRTTPSGTAVVATLLEPVTAVLIAVLFLGERLTPTGLIGALLIIVAIASLGRRPEDPQPQ